MLEEWAGKEAFFQLISDSITFLNFLIFFSLNHELHEMWDHVPSMTPVFVHLIIIQVKSQTKDTFCPKIFHLRGFNTHGPSLPF